MKYFLVAFIAAVSIGGLQVDALQAQTPTKEEIIQKLAPPAKTRSLKPNRGIDVEGGEVEVRDPSINLYVNFEYNSAELKQDALIVLDRLADALADQQLAQYDFLIGGHTDAVGSEGFNQNLSERRAQSVKNYLVKRQSITANRLIDKGYGESRLLDRQRPLDGVNRRVQIINLAIPDQ